MTEGTGVYWLRPLGHLTPPETLRATGSESELGLALGALARAKRLTGGDVEATPSAKEALAILDRLGTLEEQDRFAARARG